MIKSNLKKRNRKKPISRFNRFKSKFKNKNFDFIRYSIVDSGSELKTSLLKLSYNISIDQELFILSNPRTYLGTLNKRAMIFIGLKLISYTIEHYGDKSSEVELSKYISAANRWVEDDDDIIIDDIELVKQLFEKDEKRIEDFFEFDYILSSVAYLFRMIVDDNRDLYHVSVNLACHVASKLKKLYPYRHHFYLEDQERLNQGKMIIDFLKSGKHLFMV
jgi:hypothetical protein